MKSVLFSIALVVFFSAGSLGKLCPNTRSVCLLPKDPGPCKASFPRYYFDKKSGHCKNFIYGGCQGNGNNFKSRGECEGKCSLCFLPKDPGPCKGSFPRYHYNPCTEECEKFTYGGCHGNANNFENKDDCNNACPCNQNEIPPVNLNPVCCLPYEVGMCRARMGRYFYNKFTRRCESFYYGGCGGNKNNFRTLKECNALCFHPPRKG